MVELNKKYQISVKKFGLINWIGFKSLWLKECNRFMAVWQQTLLSPLVSSLLFLFCTKNFLKLYMITYG